MKLFSASDVKGREPKFPKTTQKPKAYAVSDGVAQSAGTATWLWNQTKYFVGRWWRFVGSTQRCKGKVNVFG
jgi:hypothetical protein